VNKKTKKICVKGPASLKGKVNVGGSKNAVLPILAATLISDEESIIRNVPDMTDITVMIAMLRVLGKTVERNGSVVTVRKSDGLTGEAPYRLVRKLRASVLVMGGLAARKKNIRVALPGGCAIGTRPIDIHLKGFKKMGADIKVSKGFVNLNSSGLRSAVINLDYPSVGATENLAIAASRTEGETVLENIAREPEVEEMLAFLEAMGVEIEPSSRSVKIRGRKEFRPVDFTVMDDRIQAGTYLIAGALKGSKVEIDFSHPHVLEALIHKLEESGADVDVDGNKIRVCGPSRPMPSEIRTAPYPGFPTDLQAPFCAYLARTKGVSVVSEEVFENRFLHCAELMRMGADLEVKGESVIVTGVKNLTGAPVKACDLRGGAALIIAALSAKGLTEITGISHIERGYDNIVHILRSLGADIREEEEVNGESLNND